MELREVLGRRRSIRFVRPYKPVEKEKIQMMLEAARIASHWGNVQSLRALVVFRDSAPPETLEAIQAPVAGWQIRISPVVIVWYIETAAVDEKLKPLLRYAKKLTEAPARITPADAEACYAAGWSDEAIMQAIAVTCLANFMNRLVEGSGVHADPSKFAMRAKAAVEKGYQRPFREKMAALGKPVG